MYEPYAKTEIQFFVRVEHIATQVQLNFGSVRDHCYLWSSSNLQISVELRYPTIQLLDCRNWALAQHLEKTHAPPAAICVSKPPKFLKTILKCKNLSIITFDAIIVIQREQFCKNYFNIAIWTDNVAEFLGWWLFSIPRTVTLFEFSLDWSKTSNERHIVVVP